MSVKRALPALLACCTAIAGCGSDDGAGRRETAAQKELAAKAAVEVQTAALQGCVDAWNAPDNNFKMIAYNYSTSGQPRATIGFDTRFTDLCFITLASPERDSATQFRQAPGDALGWKMVSQGKPATLPVSAAQWNAHVADEDGGLALD